VHVISMAKVLYHPVSGVYGQLICLFRQDGANGAHIIEMKTYSQRPLGLYFIFRETRVLNHDGGTVHKAQV
jgi:hypothetical protein